MEFLDILGYGASLLIGLSLGLIGGGGTILAVPILVYLFALKPSEATAYSLFIVGFTATIGAFRAHQKGRVNVRTGVLFGVPAIIGVFLTRYLLFPKIPEEMSVAGWAFSKDMAVMVLFSILMLAASISMIRGRSNTNLVRDPEAHRRPLVLILVEGSFVGVLTGLVGAGGGFLIIPALVFFGKLPMKVAVGTSLMIIALKSLIGFSGDLFSGMELDFYLLSSVCLLAALGILIGIKLSDKVPGPLLKKSFGWFVLVIGTLILYREIAVA